MRERNPWSPLTIAVLTLIFSPVAGGVLHGLNYARLGQGHLRRFALARNLLAGLLFLLLAIVLRQSKVMPLSATLFFAAYFYKTQENGFQVRLSKGGEKGSLMAAILIALLTALGPVVFLILAELLLTQ